MNILHLPTNVAGNSYGLARGERALGHNTTVIQAVDSWLHYPADITLVKDTPQNAIQWGKLGLDALVTFLKVYNKFDVFHFDFGSSLLDMMEKRINLWDLPYYDGVTVMTYQGCDARQKYPTMERTPFSACHLLGCYGGKCDNIYRDEIKAKRIKKVDKHIDIIYALNPDLLYFLPERAQFLPYTIPSWYNIEPVSYTVKNPIRIVHAQTDRTVKGTNTIIHIIRKLQHFYPGKIDFRLIEKVPHTQAIQEFRQADLVIDQLLVGWYGAFAVELMKMGIPVMSFVRDADLCFIPDDMAQDLHRSLINVNPYTLESSLAALIEDPSVLEHYHKQSIEYVNKWHDPEKVAKRVVDDYLRWMYT